MKTSKRIDMFKQNAEHPMRIGCRPQKFESTEPKHLDIFEENETHGTMKVTQNPVEFEPDQEVDASTIDFSKKETLEFAHKSLKEMGVL